MFKLSLHHKFYSDAITRARVKKERIGQALFNHLYQVKPELAEKVRGTDMDPFYVEYGHPNWDRFIVFIEKEWFL
mgnify:CR=1 FL=1|tara:strand:- start:8051 stop:8275 length:225 start_codon:yes stop_codon:yes gene_type:complete